MKNLILCGGIGSRLWPLSRSSMPKQFYPLINKQSLFEKTIKRNMPFCNDFLIASNKEQSFLAYEQLAGLGIFLKKGLIEPMGRNTAPAIALVAMQLDPEDILFVTPSDHLITKEKAYEQAIKRGLELASQDKIVTFGIHPSYPETGFGYIEAKGEEVLSFKEKPNQKKAEEYIKQGNYYWNSGMFCFKVRVFLEELLLHSPEVYHACLEALPKQKGSSQKILEPSYEAMQAIPSISIDYALMERSDKVVVVPCDIGWSDLGSFDSLYDQTYNINKENALLGDIEPVLIDSVNNLIISDQRKIALIDVNDLLIIDSADSLLIAKKGSSQKVKEVVAQIKEHNEDLLKFHETVKRPWGNFTILQDSPHFKVKKLTVNPHARLSLQKHKHRQEHWTVVQGLARVTVGEEIKVLSENQYVYIPLGAIHRLENIGQDSLIIIETQTGTYFGEDDIIRIEDDFNRI